MVDGLDPKLAYSYRLIAFNQAGSSEPSEVVGPVVVGMKEGFADSQPVPPWPCHPWPAPSPHRARTEPSPSPLTEPTLQAPPSPLLTPASPHPPRLSPRRLPPRPPTPIPPLPLTTLRPTPRPTPEQTARATSSVSVLVDWGAATSDCQSGLAWKVLYRPVPTPTPS